MPWTGGADDAPSGVFPPIDHVVIIIQENHTYDGYFGRLGRGNGIDTLATASDPPVLPFPWDPTHGHGWSANHGSWNDRHEQHDRRHLPLYYEWADLFPVLDDFHSEIDGPSTPNHMTLFAAASGDGTDTLINNPPAHPVLAWFGRVLRGDPAGPGPEGYDIPSLCTRLEDAGLTWGNFGDGAVQYIRGIKDSPNNMPTASFQEVARAGKLPTVSWVHPNRLSLTEHAPFTVADGMRWVSEQVEAVIAGGQWDRTAIFVLWDDFGGYFDHAPAPCVERWGHDPSQQYRYGKRVPCIVLSPYARPRYVSSSAGVTRSFVSLLAFVESLYGLDPLNDRDGTADDLRDCFDFEQVPLLPPRTALRPGELEGLPRQSFLRRVPVAAVRYYAAVVEGTVRTAEAIPLLIAAERLEPSHPRVARFIRRVFDLDHPVVGRFSLSGMPRSPVARALLIPPAALMGLVLAPLSALATWLTRRGWFNVDPAGMERRQLHTAAVQRVHGTTDPAVVAENVAPGPRPAALVAAQVRAAAPTSPRMETDGPTIA